MTTPYLDTDVLVCDGGSAGVTAVIAAALSIKSNTQFRALDTDHLRARLMEAGALL